jgi:hypothetical protein
MLSQLLKIISEIFYFIVEYVFYGIMLSYKGKKLPSRFINEQNLIFLN